MIFSEAVKLTIFGFIFSLKFLFIHQKLRLKFKNWFWRLLDMKILIFNFNYSQLSKKNFLLNIIVCYSNPPFPLSFFEPFLPPISDHLSLLFPQFPPPKFGCLPPKRTRDLSSLNWENTPDFRNFRRAKLTKFEQFDCPLRW